MIWGKLSVFLVYFWIVDGDYEGKFVCDMSQDKFAYDYILSLFLNCRIINDRLYLDNIKFKSCWILHF